MNVNLGICPEEDSVGINQVKMSIRIKGTVDPGKVLSHHS